MNGTELRRRRKQLGLSMQAFATEAGIGIGTLQRYETKNPRRDLEHRGLDRYRVTVVRQTLERLENGNGRG